MSSSPLDLPLAGLKVIEISHMVMGPSAGLILADLGAEVIKIEPLEGDKTRNLKGSGAGYFPMYNRNKKSLALDIKNPRGNEIVRKLVAEADIFIENFRAGAMARLDLDYKSLSRANPRLIYCSEKGFLSGPYAKRTALDEVAQMMGGLAYMTGPPGRPLRAGASVVDVMGGTFGAVAILAALTARSQTGKGQYVESGLYENVAFLVGQHMAQYAVTGTAAAPMPVRISAWAVYDIFETADNEQIFVGVVSDSQWEVFCKIFELTQWQNDSALAENNARVARRDEILPPIRAIFAQISKQDALAKLEAAGLPFAPIQRPEDMFTDPHLNAEGGLVALTLPDGTDTMLPALPIAMGAQRFGCYRPIPQISADMDDILTQIGFDDAAIQALIDADIVAPALAPPQKDETSRDE